MNMPAKIVSLIALGAVMVSCLLYFSGAIGLDAMQWSALAGTIGWFVATPMWMDRRLPVDATQVEI